MSMERFSINRILGAAMLLGLVCARSEAAGTLLTEQDLAFLPVWCREVQHVRDMYGTPGGTDAWIAKVGRDFMHMHHYCDAKVAVMKADRARVSSGERKHWLLHAVNHYNYVIRNSKPSFVLLPEVYVQRANARIRQDLLKEALEDLETAKTLRPDYVPIYLTLAQLFQDGGNKDRARAALEEGLKAIPTSNVLRQSLAEFDSKSR